MDEIIFPQPDDFHVHLRDGKALERTVADVSRQCGRALVMPNLVPAVDSLEALLAYKARIETYVINDFQPLMTLYLSAALTPEVIKNAKKAGIVAVKWYPKGATTNSAQGLADKNALYPVLEEMQRQEILLLIHGEVTAHEIDIFDRESTFIETTLKSLRADFPDLKIVLEHITTTHAVDYILSENNKLAATITAHHLLATRNDLLVGGIKPHFYCLPILKSEKDRQALLKAATSGDSRFFLGTDSAPHEKFTKENSCGCAGCYTSAYMLELYATAFEEVHQLDKLANFASKFGADFYGLAYNQKPIKLVRKTQTIPETLEFSHSQVIPFWAGKTLNWCVEQI